MKRNRTVVLIVLLVLAGGALVYDRFLKSKDPDAERASIIAAFTNLYYSEGIHYRTKWLGIPTLENPCDMWAIQEVICETKPDIIIETGTFKGGGAVFYASVLQNVNENGKVISVDIKPQMEEAARTKLFQDRVEFIEGSSVSDEVIAKIRDRIKGLRVMVTLDSDHHMDHVLKELRLYSGFVTKGCYLIVQDTSHNGHPLKTTYGKGPWEALEAFQAEDKSFEVDLGRGKFLLTFHPKGFLRRVS